MLAVFRAVIPNRGS